MLCRRYKIVCLFSIPQHPSDCWGDERRPPRGAQQVLQKSTFIKSRQDESNRFWEPTDDFEAPWVSFVFIGKGHLSCTISQIPRRDLDANLTFDDHIKTTVSECIARLAQISRVKHCLDRTSLLTAINSLVFSKLSYCSNVWANTTEKIRRKLQAVQNFACRIVSGVRKYDHITPHLKSCLLYTSPSPRDA